MSITDVLTNPLDILKGEVPEPKYKVVIDGTDITNKIKPRLMNLTLTDNRGFDADQVELQLDDSDGLLTMPRRGASMRVWLGWKGTPLIDKGSFTVDELEHAGAPDTLTITGRSVDFRESLNVKKERSFHGKKLSEIIDTIAKNNGLFSILSTSLKDEVIDHIDQTNESDAAFLVRLAKQFDTIPTVKDGRLLFVRAGLALTATGKAMPAVVIKRSAGDQHRFSVADRDAYTGVVAYWHDKKQAEKKVVKLKRRKRKKKTTTTTTTTTKDTTTPTAVVKENELLIGSDENVKHLRYIYANQKNAERAAKVAWQRLQRGVAEFSITLATGRPELITELPVKVKGFKPQIDEGSWLSTKVIHNVTENGYTSQLELEVKIDELPE
jgi:Phage protein D